MPKRDADGPGLGAKLLGRFAETVLEAADITEDEAVTAAKVVSRGIKFLRRANEHARAEVKAEADRRKQSRKDPHRQTKGRGKGE